MMNETPEPRTPNPEPRYQPPPRKPLAPWVVVLPLALLAGALWQSSREPEEPLQAPALSGDPVPAARRRPAAATGKADESALPKIERVLFVPDENGDLRKVVVQDTYPGPTTDWPHFYGAMSAHLVNGLLFTKFPQHFPPDSQVVEPAKVEGDVVTLSFNKNFAKPEFWQGETKTLSALYSIVNTIAAFPESKRDVKVRFLIEGKPIQTLGEFDVSEPVEPDMAMVAKR